MYCEIPEINSGNSVFEVILHVIPEINSGIHNELTNQTIRFSVMQQRILQINYRERNSLRICLGSETLHPFFYNHSKSGNTGRISNMYTDIPERSTTLSYLINDLEKTIKGLY